MRSFSERAGIRSLKAHLADALEPSLRNRLWNVIHSSYFSSAAWSPELNRFIDRLWDEFFKWPQDAISHATVFQTIRDHYFHAEWNEVYDFIEFCAGAYSAADVNARFMARANSVFVQECAPYRFVGQRLVRIASATEIEVIEQALVSAHPLDAVEERLHRALDFLADRRAPDCGASIRESLAVLDEIKRALGARAPKMLTLVAASIEAVLRACARPEKSSQLGRLWEDLFGGQDARRDEAGFEDAKFALVVCSAAVNYALAHAALTGPVEISEQNPAIEQRAKARA